MSNHFTGFPGGKVRITPLPAAFFTDLLAQVDHLGELKVTLYAFWALDRQEGTLRFLRYADFAGDERLLTGFGAPSQAAEAALADSLQRAVKRGTLLMAQVQGGNLENAVFFLNSPRGRAALKSLQAGEWRPEDIERSGLTLQHERPNIYRLYEENIGPLTPLLAQAE